MKIYLDSAELNLVCDYVSWYHLDGVTSNPSILKKSDCQLADFLMSVPNDVECFAQVIQTTYEGILEDAQAILDMRKDTIIKIPVSKEGLRAIHTLHTQGVRTLATAIYHASQAMLAAKCGANYVAPYVNRKCDLELDGIQTTLDIQQAFNLAQIPCSVVAASFKNLHQIQTLLSNGIDAITVPLDLFEKMIDFPYTKKAVEDFGEDWKKLSGKEAI